jgi:hypothetical protein
MSLLSDTLSVGPFCTQNPIDTALEPLVRIVLRWYYLSAPANSDDVELP